MNPDEQAIRQLMAEWLSATRDGDVDKVLSLMSPDVVFLVPGQAPMQGRDAFGQVLRAVLATHAIESTSEIDEVEIVGDLAYCRTRLTVTTTSKHSHTPTERKGHTLSILRKGSDGRWLLTRDANLLAPAA